jgi:hypothetical protein
LWPDEPAWKVKFEFSQQSDFAGQRIVDGAKHPGAAGPPAGFLQLCAQQPDQCRRCRNRFERRSPENPSGETIHGHAGQNNYMQGGLTIQADSALPDGMRMTLVKPDG